MDTLIRELERSAAAGDPGAQTRLLTERVRAGDLGSDRLGLAAFLGDPRAMAASGVEPADVVLEDGKVGGLISATDVVRRFGEEARA